MSIHYYWVIVVGKTEIECWLWKIYFYKWQIKNWFTLQFQGHHFTMLLHLTFLSLASTVVCYVQGHLSIECRQPVIALAVYQFEIADIWFDCEEFIPSWQNLICVDNHCRVDEWSVCFDFFKVINTMVACVNLGSDLGHLIIIFTRIHFLWNENNESIKNVNTTEYSPQGKLELNVDFENIFKCQLPN